MLGEMVMGRREGRKMGILAAVAAGLLLTVLVVVSPAPRSAVLEELEPEFDWETVPEVEAFPSDYTGMMRDDGTIMPSPCKEVCRACFLGGIQGQDRDTYPHGEMRSESCQLCKCEEAIPPVFDYFDKLGYCNHDTCEACESGKLEGRPCFECSCGLWSYRKMETVCPHRDQVCYSCLMGSLQGASCDRCLCGYWDGAKKKTDTPFGAHDCVAACHKCNNGLINDPVCEMCFCAQYPVSKPVVEEVEPQGVKHWLGEWEKSVAEAKQVIAEGNKALEDHKVPELPKGEQQPVDLPHYAWMDDSPKSPF